MKNSYLFTLLIIALSVKSCCGVISVTPDTDQYLPINSPLNVTFSCNVSENEVNSMERQAIWEVEERQIQSGQNPVRTAFERIGIYIEEVSLGTVDLIITSQARMQYQDTGIMVRCTAFTPDEPPITELGEALFVITYGNPDVPVNLRLMTSYLNWDRPTNIPEEVEVNYTVTINSSNSELGNRFHLSDQIQLSIEFLEMALADAERCEVFMFYVVASVANAGDSVPAVATYTVPFSRNVSSIDKSLRVNSLTFIDDGDVMADISFNAVEICSNFLTKNYTLLVDSSRGRTVIAMSSVTLVTIILTPSDLPFLVSDQIFQVGVEVCNDVICLSSTTVPLYTSDVQSARVIFFDNNVFLFCSFADGSLAVGCMFTFQVNLNGTGNEEFIVLQSMGGQLCNVTANQLSGYMDIVVFDLESDGVSVTPVSIIVDIVTVGSEDDYTEMTGCTVQQEVVQVIDSKAVSIAVPIVIVVLLVSVVVVSVIVLVVYLRLEKKKPKLAESASPDTLYLDIASDNQKLLHTTPITRPSNSQSLPMTSKSGIALSHDPEASLPALHSQHPAPFFSVPAERAAPIEVELHRNTIKLKINKTSLRAMARFAKQHIQPDGSLSLEEGQSLLSRVHMSDDFKSLCCELPPVEEGGEEEEELKSWGIINTPFNTPPSSLEQKSAL